MLLRLDHRYVVQIVLHHDISPQVPLLTISVPPSLSRSSTRTISRRPAENCDAYFGSGLAPHVVRRAEYTECNPERSICVACVGHCTVREASGVGIREAEFERSGAGSGAGGLVNDAPGESCACGMIP